mmetsp:Transcript_90219/g.232908  ORF Transcript_90219/g.232908 Transcript_90219/m.232908 type:complete len:287 (+) Transcript_90219:235-1095(+)
MCFSFEARSSETREARSSETRLSRRFSNSSFFAANSAAAFSTCAAASACDAALGDPAGAVGCAAGADCHSFDMSPATRPTSADTRPTSSFTAFSAPVKSRCTAFSSSSNCPCATSLPPALGDGSGCSMRWLLGGGAGSTGGCTATGAVTRPGSAQGESCRRATSPRSSSGCLRRMCSCRNWSDWKRLGQYRHFRAAAACPRFSSREELLLRLRVDSPRRWRPLAALACDSLSWAACKRTFSSKACEICCEWEHREYRNSMQSWANWITFIKASSLVVSKSSLLKRE